MATAITLGGTGYYVIVDAAAVVRCPFKFDNYDGANTHRKAIQRDIQLFVAKAEQKVSLSIMPADVHRHCDYTFGRTRQQIRQQLEVRAGN